jgi:hypothetical protein
MVTKDFKEEEYSVICEYYMNHIPTFAGFIGPSCGTHTHRARVYFSLQGPRPAAATHTTQNKVPNAHCPSFQT